jgi:hypothetical protein
MRDHISRVTRSCFYQLRRLRTIRHHLGLNVTKCLVCSFVLSRLDYCNSLLAGLPAASLAPLQRVQNAAARLVLGLKTRDHITPALMELHWLPIKQRISYKLCILVHKSLHHQEHLITLLNYSPAFLKFPPAPHSVLHPLANLIFPGQGYTLESVLLPSLEHAIGIHCQPNCD